MDYSFSEPVTVSIGGYDLTSCFKSLELSLALHEPEQPLVWSGSLTMVLTVAAQQAGITDADLDPLLSRARYASGLQMVLIGIGGRQLQMRLRDWRYDAATRTATGQLGQQIELYDQAYPSVDPDTVYAGNRTEINVAIRKLLDAANRKATVAIGIGDVGNDGRTMWGSRSTRQPLGEVQQYARCSWAWLTQSLVNSSANILELDYYASPLVFARPLSQCSVVPSYGNLHFAAPRVIAHGSADVPAKCQDEATEATEGNAEVNERGYPVVQVTELTEPFGKVFPQLGSNTKPITSQRKTVRYYYVTDRVLKGSEYTPASVPPNVTDEASGLYRTETEIEEPAGRLFPQLGTNATMRVAVRAIETAEWKAVFKPAGVVFPQLGTSFNLILDSLEQLQTQFVPRGGARGGVSPETGAHVCVDKAKPERPQPVELKLEPRAYRGEAVTAQDYVAPLDYPLVYNMGFCPSNAAATLVAKRLAVREVARRYADDVQLPLPLEWLDANCPHFARAHIGTRLYWLDGPTMRIDTDEAGCQTASLSFTGLPLSTATAVPEPPKQRLYDPAAGGTSWPTSVAALQSYELRVSLPGATSLSGAPAGVSLQNQQLVVGAATPPGNYQLTVNSAPIALSVAALVSSPVAQAVELSSVAEFILEHTATATGSAPPEQLSLGEYRLEYTATATVPPPPPTLLLAEFELSEYTATAVRGSFVLIEPRFALSYRVTGVIV